MKSSRSLSMKSVVSLRSLDICNFIISPTNRLVVHSIHKSINLKPPEICCLFCWVDSVKVQHKTSWLTAVKLSLAHTSEIHNPTQQSWKADVIDSCQQYHRKTWFPATKHWKRPVTRMAMAIFPVRCDGVTPMLCQNRPSGAYLPVTFDSKTPRRVS